MNRYGEYFKALRNTKNLSLREVERATGISNAYLSQLENDKIKQPSPITLYKLASLYEVDYEILMEKVGYPTSNSSSQEKKESKESGINSYGRLGKITQSEEVALLEYLAFIRRKK